MAVANDTPKVWVFNPADAADLDLARDVGGNFFDLSRVLKLPAVTSNALTVGQALLLDPQYLRLFVRQGIRLDMDTSGAALFDANLCKLRCEGRFAFAVLRPSSVGIVDLTVGA